MNKLTNSLMSQVISLMSQVISFMSQVISIDTFPYKMVKYANWLSI